jgi:hypothetical protein
MRVIKFFTINHKNKDIKRIVWYSPDNVKRSAVIHRVEEYLHGNQISCLMDVVKWYHDRKEFEREYDKHEDIKAKFDYIILGAE